MNDLIDVWQSPKYTCGSPSWFLAFVVCWSSIFIVKFRDLFIGLLHLFRDLFYLYRYSLREKIRISPYSVEMWENTDLNNSDYGRFSRSFNVYLILSSSEFHIGLSSDPKLFVSRLYCALGMNINIVFSMS